MPYHGLETWNSGMIILFVNFTSFMLYCLSSFLYKGLTYSNTEGKKKAWLRDHSHFYLLSIFLFLCFLSLSLSPSFYLRYCQYWEFHTYKYFTRYHLSPTLGNFLFLSNNNWGLWKYFGGHAHSLFYIQSNQGKKERKNSDSSLDIVQMLQMCYYNAFGICYHGNSSPYLQSWQKNCFE